jgi:hypothetical protein
MQGRVIQPCAANAPSIGMPLLQSADPPCVSKGFLTYETTQQLISILLSLHSYFPVQQKAEVQVMQATHRDVGS